MDDDENISTLLAMGFPDISEIKRALRMAKNDLSEAVAVLTNDSISTTSSGTTFGPEPRPNSRASDKGANDVDMKDGGGASSQPEDSPNGFPLANYYELETRVFQDNWNIPYKTEESFGRCLEAAAKMSKEGTFCQDEHCVKFVEKVLPEAFKKLLTSNATMRWHNEVQEGIYDMVELFVDLAVARLRDGDEVGLVGPTEALLGTLAMVFDPKTDWNHRNKDKSSRGRWESRTSSSSSRKEFVHPPKDSFSRAQFGWLCDLINIFGEQGGFDHIFRWLRKMPSSEDDKEKKDSEDKEEAMEHSSSGSPGGEKDKKSEEQNKGISLSEAAALLAPVANCADMLERDPVQAPLLECLEFVFSRVESLRVADLKNRDVSSVSHLLASAKLLCLQFGPSDAARADELRLGTVLRMLKTPQFNSKMTALKEVSRLIDETKQKGSGNSRRNLTSEEVQRWMAENRVLSVALEGNIDQVQYTDRIQAIVEFLGPRLEESELTKMWRMAERAGNAHVADNVCGMLAASASKLTPTQFEHLTSLVRETWEGLGKASSSASSSARERLLALVGRIGREASQTRSTQSVLELLWELAHRPGLPKDLVEKALSEQLAILADMSFNKDAARRAYVLKCVDDLKAAGDSVGFAVRHLHDICKTLSKGTSLYHKADKATLAELNKQHEIVKLLTSTLRKCLSNMTLTPVGSPTSGPNSGKGSTLTKLVAATHDGRYTRKELVDFHLDLLQFLLKEGDLYLSWIRCQELWDTLISSQSPTYEREEAFKWFQNCLTDLEVSTQTRFFEERLLSLRPEDVSESAFECFKAYFESINVTNGSMRKGTNPPFTVDNLDLSGLDFVWKLVTEASSEKIASSAIEYLLNMSYLFVSSRLKEERNHRLHTDFIRRCYACLESVLHLQSASASTSVADISMQEEDSSTSESALEEGHELETSISKERTASQALMAISISNVSRLPVNVRGERLQQATRVLHLAERYISTIEESCSSSMRRSILPHAATFHGRKREVKVTATSDAGKKEEFVIQTHANEIIANVKTRVAEALKQPSAEALKFSCGELELGASKDRCLLGSLGDEEEFNWTVKTLSSSSSSTALVLFQEDFGDFDSVNSGTGAGATAAAASSSAMSSPSSGRHDSDSDDGERSLPGVIMASGGKVFPMLYQVASLNDPKIVRSVRKIVHLIPTDPAVQEALDTVLFGTGTSTSPRPPFAAATTDATSPKLSPRRKKAAPSLTPSGGGGGGVGGVAGRGPSSMGGGAQHSSSPEPQSDWGGNETLRLPDLLNSRADGMNPFRVLYNLEVLSARLMPTHAAAVPAAAAQDFATKFLHSGGLAMVLGVMDKNAMPADVDYEIRQSAYRLALQLARHLLSDHQIIVGRGGVGGGIINPPLTPSTSASGGATASPSASSLGTSLTSSPLVKPTPPKRSALDSSISAASAASATSTSASSCPPSVVKSPLAISATRLMQTMSETDFGDTVSCLMRVVWAAAAGNLQLSATSNIPSSTSESSTSSSGISSSGGKPRKISDRPRFFLGNRRSRDSSTGSSGSDGSSLDSQSLHAGVCAQQTIVGPRDCQIAGEAFELLVTCLQMRSSHLPAFLAHPLLSDFVIDTVLGSPSEGVRATARDQLVRLSKARHAARALKLDDSTTSGQGSPQSLTPKQTLTKMILKTPVPLWAPTCSARGISHSTFLQCSEYFDLRCALLRNMSSREQAALGESAESMVDDELTFLQNFTLCNRHEDCCLLAGHLRLLEALLTCEGVDKKKVGATIISDLLATFLFPASKLMKEGALDKTGSSGLSFELFKDLNPKCDTPRSRVAAYSVLLELSRGCADNLRSVASGLVAMHHSFSQDLVREFEHSPAVERRAESDFVGLKNAGATCYMNSVLQQLFCVPGVAAQMLAINSVDEEEEESVFYQLQNVFGHLQESRLKYYEPEKFWHCFRLYGQPVNVREQQDALEFFIQVVDQVDEHLHKLGRPKLFSSKFEGVFSDQKICQGCPCRYEREETFMALNLTVKSNNLQDSLDQFVKGELLDGDNAYYCEKCKAKRNAIKRMCIRTLPQTLVIQLKRFHYDWETNRALKFDDFFQFPWTIDMSPYTTQGIAATEDLGGLSSSNLKSPRTPSSSSQSSRRLSFGRKPGDFSSPQQVPECPYELVGVVVHSGQATAGHYYSFIKERSRGRWLKFNDTTVEAFDMNDETLTTECFGGTFKAKKDGKIGNSNLPETRQRYWNAYILVYEQAKTRAPLTPVPKKSVSQSQTTAFSSSRPQRGGNVTSTGSGSSTGDISMPRPLPRTSEPAAASSSTVSARAARESLSQLSDLLEKGERRGLFSSRMPASIERSIQEENLRFLENRDVFCDEYYQFVQDLLLANNIRNPSTSTKEFEEMCEESVRLAAAFLCNTYFHVRERQSAVMADMIDGVSSLLDRSARATECLLSFLSSSESSGGGGLQYLRPFLLECPAREVRVNFAKMVFDSARSLEKHRGGTQSESVNRILSSLVGLIEKDVPAHNKNCAQFFWLLSKFAQMGPSQCRQLFQLNLFSQVVKFLLGIEADPGDDFDAKKHRRRWSSVQAKDHGELHSLLAYLILSCDVQPLEAHGKEAAGTQAKSPSSDLSESVGGGDASSVRTPPTVSRLLHGPAAPVFVREAVCACREVSGPIDPIVKVMVKVSRDSQKLSAIVIEEVMQQYNTINSGELKNLSVLLLELLILNDSLQQERVRFAVEGDSSLKIQGLLQLVKENQSSDSLRAYQCIKTLVNASNKSASVKEFLLLDPDRWQWSVNWLKNRMSDGDTWASHVASGGGAASTSTASAVPASSSSSRSYASANTWGSNEDSSTRTFQRTTSAQVTLDEARAILAEFGEVGQQEEEGSGSAKEDAERRRIRSGSQGGGGRMETEDDEVQDSEMPDLQEVPSID